MGVDYKVYVALLKNYMTDKGISDADLKQYDTMLQDKVKNRNVQRNCWLLC